MIYGIISAFLGALGDVVYKKSLELANGKISDKYYQFIGNFFMAISLPFFYLLLDYQSLNIVLFLLLVGSAILTILSEFFEQYAYKNEKISVLIPFGEFQSIFTVFIGFFIFSDNSIISFICAMLAGITLVIGGLDFKKFKFNKYCIAMGISALLGSIKYIIYGYLLLTLSEFSIMFFNVVISFILLFIIVLSSKEIKQYKKITSKLSGFIILENFIRLVISFITLFLIKELGLIQAVLVGMLYLLVSLIFSFVVFKNIPSKKDVLVVFFVFLFVSLGTFLGN